MAKLNVIIVEDEIHSRETLKNMVNTYCQDLKIVGIASSVREGLDLLKAQNPDLVFLDIEMQNETGFDLLTQAQHLNFEVIFTTAYEHYALKAIKFSAIDYLLKPIDVEDLQHAVAKVIRKKEEALHNKKLEVLLDNIKNTNSDQHMITLSTSEGYEFINVADICYCEANGSYTDIYIKNDKHILVSRHLKEYENLLTDYNFMRVHQSFLINLNEVEKYIKSDGGYIVMKGGANISISPKKKEEFIHKMGAV